MRRVHGLSCRYSSATLKSMQLPWHGTPRRAPSAKWQARGCVCDSRLCCRPGLTAPCQQGTLPCICCESLAMQHCPHHNTGTQTLACGANIHRHTWCGVPQFGQSSDVRDLDAEGQQTLSEAFECDPEWAPKGPMLFDDPGAGAGGRVVVELFEQAAPRAVNNFLSLCSGAAGVGKASKKPLHYKVCPALLGRLRCEPIGGRRVGGPVLVGSQPRL